MSFLNRYRFQILIALWAAASIVGYCESIGATTEYLIVAVLGQLVWVVVMWISIHTLRINERALTKAREELSADHDKHMEEMQQRYLRGVEHDNKATLRMRGLLDDMKKTFGDEHGY